MKALTALAAAAAFACAANALATPELNVHIAGSGDARLGGRTAKLEVHIAGSGSVRRLGAAPG